MKRLTMIAASLLLLGGVASAQQSKTDETLEFRPHWSLNVQGGVAHTRGESSFSELLYLRLNFRPLTASTTRWAYASDSAAGRARVLL